MGRVNDIAISLSIPHKDTQLSTTQYNSVHLSTTQYISVQQHNLANKENKALV